MVHGDDFVSTADIEDLRWVESMLNENFEITTDIIGHDEERKKQLKVLNRFVSAKVDTRTSQMSDIRCQTRITRAKNCLDNERFKTYQSSCARENFLATDRIDLSMSWSRFQRFGRFLAGCQKMLTAYSDANWTKNASDRRSTCGGVLIPSPSFTPW